MTSVSIEVERPAAEVFHYATDPSTFHEWQQGVVSGSMESKGETTVGATAGQPAVSAGNATPSFNASRQAR